MIRTFGQTPKQLFDRPHPKRKIRTASVGHQEPMSLIDTVVGLHLGDVVGLSPLTQRIYAASDGHNPVVLLPVGRDRMFGLPPDHNCLIRFGRQTSPSDDFLPTGACLIGLNPETGWAQAWLRTGEAPRPILPLESAHNGDRVISSSCTPGSDTLFFGYQSGKLLAVTLQLESQNLLLALKDTREAFGHGAAINAIASSKSWGVVVSSSEDGTTIIWDTRALDFVRSIAIPPKATPHRLISLSEPTGDLAIVTADSDLSLYSLNGSPVAQHCRVEPPITALAFSHLKEGTGLNLVATGHKTTGVVRLWSSWDLSPLRDLSTNHVNAGLLSVAFSLDSGYLYASFDDAYLVIFERRSSSAGLSSDASRPPNYLDLSMVQ